jgi:predicted phosphodiesterase
MTQSSLETSRFAIADSNSLVQRAVSRLRKNRFEETITLDLKQQQTHTLKRCCTRVPLGQGALELKIGDHRLHIYPDLGIKCQDTDTTDLIVLDPDHYFSQMSQYQRLKKNRKIEVRYTDDEHKKPLNELFQSKQFCVQISHEGNALVFTQSGTKTPSSLSLLSESNGIQIAVSHRQHALDMVLEIFGGPIETLPPDQALDLIKSVNNQMSDSQYQAKSDDGFPGGLVELPENLTPIIIGDLHACIDNLLKILSESALMQELNSGTSALVFLGDAVHDESKETSARMDTSVLIMDLIFKLKQRYSNQVFYILGNHDSFSEEVSKCGVPQGQLWGEHLKATRGEEYLNELQRFYHQSPRVALSTDFAACHAGPPRARFKRDCLVNLRANPHLAQDITWIRMKTPASPSGYGSTEVRRFRSSLGLDKDAPLIVAHTPFDPDSTVWHDIGRIPHHHVVYSARPDKVGVFFRINGRLVSQVYSTEPLLEWLNKRARLLNKSLGTQIPGRAAPDHTQQHTESHLPKTERSCHG